MTAGAHHGHWVPWEVDTQAYEGVWPVTALTWKSGSEPPRHPPSSPLPMVKDTYVKTRDVLWIRQDCIGESAL